MKIDDVVDVVIIPFYECYPASCRFCNLKMKPLGKFGFLNTPIESFRQHIEPSDVERVAEWNAQNYIILGGEPTLSKYLIDLIDVIREKSNGKIILYTNGFLLGKYMKAKGFDDRVRYLIYSIDRLVLSMEGSKQYNDAIRGKGFTDLSHYIIDKLSEYIDVSVRMGFHDRNMKYIIEEMEYLNVPVLLFPRLDRLPIRRAYEFYHFVAGCENAWILLPSYTNFIEDLIGRGEPKPCPAGHMKLCILPDGTITPCQWIDTPIATLKNKDEEIEVFAEKWVRRAFVTPTECTQCKYRNICMGGCRVARDYRWCPLRVSAASEGSIEMFGYKRSISRRKVEVRVKKLNDVLVHGCSAGC